MSQPFHAAKEIDKVISKKGFSWFAKFGKPLKTERIILDDDNEKTFYACLLVSENDAYELHTYRILDFSSVMPKAGQFPPYYKKNLLYIETWLKLGPNEGVSPTVNDLVVTSSQTSLLLTMRRSMMGHFFCKQKYVPEL